MRAPQLPRSRHQMDHYGTISMLTMPFPVANNRFPWPDAVKRANPRCIFLSLPGFSSNDEEFKDTKAFEAVVMAQSGVYCDMGLNRKLQTAHFVSLQVI